MKKSTKILSVFMAIVMVITCVPMTVFAKERKTDSLKDYLSNANLAVVVEDLLTALDDRKDEIVPTALNICFQLIDALKAQADEDGIDVTDAETEELADSLLTYLDAVLEEAEGEIPGQQGNPHKAHRQGGHGIRNRAFPPHGH